MDQDTRLAQLLKQAEDQTREFERLVPQLLALGDVHISLPLDAIEDICRPLPSVPRPIPNCALRA